MRAATSKRAEVRDGNRVLATGSFTINGNSQEALAVDFLGDPVSNTLTNQGSGTRVTSTTSGLNSRTTSAYASQSTLSETLDAEKLGVNNLYGGSGDDTLIAASTGSWLVGGNGSNAYIGGQGDDVFVISASDDTRNICGNGGRDTAIIVGTKDVFLNMANAGLTIAEGGDGNDVIISGGTGSTFIKGGSGNSTLMGGEGSDVLVGGTGHNTIIGGSGKLLFTLVRTAIPFTPPKPGASFMPVVAPIKSTVDSATMSSKSVMAMRPLMVMAESTSLLCMVTMAIIRSHALPRATKWPIRLPGEMVPSH